MKILFVCAQNVGRSQMAAALFNKYSRTAEADSAGTNVQEPGQRIGERAQISEGANNVLRVLDEENLDIRANERRPLTEDMLAGYDKIIVMAEQETVPAYLKNSAKTEYWRIDDPRHKGLDATRQTRDEIKAKVLQLIEQIEHRAG